MASDESGVAIGQFDRNVRDVPPWCLRCEYHEIDEHHTHVECVRCGWTAGLEGQNA